MANSKPYHPPKYQDADILAIQALEQGIANEGQQKRALAWIVNEVSGYYDMSFYPGEEGRRDTDFAEGKRFVGSHIVKMLKLKTGGKQ